MSPATRKTGTEQPLSREEFMYLPLIHRGDRTRALVVGGGEVAKRKVMDLLEAQATVHAISPTWHPELLALLERDAIEHETRPYQPGDVANHNLVIVATDDETLNRVISEEARQLGIPVNVVDQPDLCTVYFAAVVRRDPLLLAVSTGGAAPFFARELKYALNDWIDEGWALRARWAEQLRTFAVQQIEKPENRERLFRHFMGLDLETLATWTFEHPPVQLWKAWSREEEA